MRFIRLPSLRAFARLVAIVAVCCLAAGCVALPVPRERPIETAERASAATALGRVAAASIAAADGSGDSGFRLVHSGTHALDARLALVRAARRTLDVQYYHVAGDDTGRGFLRELRDAAARGVRVRLIVDDLYTSGQHDALAGLAAHPNVSLRLFNPFPLRDGGLLQRFTASLPSVDRLQRRMHNKLLVADGAFAVAGGRNVADMYYWRSGEDAFFDLDVLLAGRVVDALEDLFDLYWNSDRVFPVGELGAAGAAPRRQDFDAWVDGAVLPAAPPIPVDLLGYARLPDELQRGTVRLYRGDARAVADVPGKQIDDVGSPDDPWSAPSAIRRAFNDVLRGAQREVVLVTPYAVPGPGGMARLRANRARGVEVRILTNSLASTDEPSVHSGYRRYRRAMLETGTALYELDPQPSARMEVAEMRGRPTLRIHTKSAIVDRRVVWIGSMNLDPRSAALNTEIGIVVDHEAFAHDVLTFVERVMRDGAWTVELQDDGGLRWRRGDGETFGDEPRTGWWQRLRLDVLSVLVPEAAL